MSSSLPWKSGEHVVICSVSGQAFYSSDCVRRYDGAIVARRYNDNQHPQELIRVRPERPVRPPLNSAPPDVFVSGSSGEALLEESPESEFWFELDESGTLTLLEDADE